VLLDIDRTFEKADKASKKANKASKEAEKISKEAATGREWGSNKGEAGKKWLGEGAETGSPWPKMLSEGKRSKSFFERDILMENDKGTT
jgi:hypothetical protein